MGSCANLFINFGKKKYMKGEKYKILKLIIQIKIEGRGCEDLWIIWEDVDNMDAKYKAINIG